MSKKLFIAILIIAAIIGVVGGFLFVQKQTPMDSGIEGTAMLGPTCPVMRNPPDPGCADRPYTGELAVMSADSTRTITTFTTDSNGTFRVNVAPGTYTIRNTGNAMLPRCSSSGTITVTAHTYANTDVSCDTGIR